MNDQRGTAELDEIMLRECVFKRSKVGDEQFCQIVIGDIACGNQKQPRRDSPQEMRDHEITVFRDNNTPIHLCKGVDFLVGRSVAAR